MSEIDIQSRLEELQSFEKTTNDLSSKFDNLVKSYTSITSKTSAKDLGPLPSTTKCITETICTECSSEFNHRNGSQHESSCMDGANKSTTSEETTCSACLSTTDPNVYSPIWFLSRSEKLQLYENAINESGRLTEPEMAISFIDGPSTTNSNDDKKTFAEITKYKRDIKRKRMKYRTTKAPPLTHTEELRSLISLQMELWEEFVAQPRNVKR